MIYKIESKQNPKIKELLLLRKASGRLSANEFIIEGFHLLEMALLKGNVKRVFLTKENNLIPSNIPQCIISEEILQKISEEKSPQGVVAVCELLKKNDNFSDHILYLDDISDPGNLGTLLRTALAFGYNTVLLSKNSCSIYNEKAIQSSQGAIFDLNIVEGYSKLDELKASGYEILATEIKGSVSLDSVKAKTKHVLVLGNEAHGVSEAVLKLADKRIRIDIENIESLNVGVAGGIAMYKLSR